MRGMWQEKGWPYSKAESLGFHDLSGRRQFSDHASCMLQHLLQEAGVEKTTKSIRCPQKAQKGRVCDA